MLNIDIDIEFMINDIRFMINEFEFMIYGLDLECMT